MKRIKITNWDIESKVVRITAKSPSNIITVTKIAEEEARIWVRVDNPLNRDDTKTIITALSLGVKVAGYLNGLPLGDAYDMIAHLSRRYE